MRCLLPGAFLAMLVGGIMVRAENPLPIESANVLPLAIDDFEFRKFEIFRNAAPCSGSNTDSDERPDGRLRAETQALGSAGWSGRLSQNRSVFHLFLACKKSSRPHNPIGISASESQELCAGQGNKLSECEGKPYVRICDRRKRLRNRRPDHFVASDFDRGSKNCGASSVSNLAMNSTESLEFDT